MSEHASPGLVLVVDDDSHARMLHREILAKKFDVVTASSGEEALSLFDKLSPDLVLMDASMPGVNGYEACARIRERSMVPVIFVTAHTDLEEHMKAYDSGGTGLLTKPASAEILIRKVSTAIERYRSASQNEREKNEYQRMAMNFLSSAGQNGVLINFMRTSIASPTYEHLATALLEATTALGMDCIIRISHDEGVVVKSAHGEPSALEISILDQVADMGRLFQFRNRLVVNFDRVSVVASNVPADQGSAEAGAFRDNLAILAEAAQALSENIDLRVTAAKQAEQMQVALIGTQTALDGLNEHQRLMFADIRLLLQDLVDGVEKSYAWLNTSQAQETTISGHMQAAVDKILQRLMATDEFEAQFSKVRDALRVGYVSEDSVQLF
nr:response regulator [Dechloromonas sp.]